MKYYESVGEFHVDLSDKEEADISKNLKRLRYKFKDIIFKDKNFNGVLKTALKDVNSIASITSDFNSNSPGNNARVGKGVLAKIKTGDYHDCNFKEEWLVNEILNKLSNTTQSTALNTLDKITTLENKLVTSGLKAAVTLAMKYKGALDTGDAIQQANLGLMEAAKRFDPDKGVKFITFAYHKMEYKLRHQSSIDATNVVRIPAKDRDSYASGWLSLEEDVDVGRQRSLQDILPDKNAESLDSIVDKKKIRKALKKALLECITFDQRELLIIYYRYLSTNRVLTYQEVAERLAKDFSGRALSRERIRQLEDRAIKKLQNKKGSLEELFNYFK